MHVERPCETMHYWCKVSGKILTRKAVKWKLLAKHHNLLKGDHRISDVLMVKLLKYSASKSDLEREKAVFSGISHENGKHHGKNIEAKFFASFLPGRVCFITIER